MLRIIAIIAIALVTLALIILVVTKLLPALQSGTANFKLPTIRFGPSNQPAEVVKDGTNTFLDNAKVALLKKTVTVVDNIDKSLTNSLSNTTTSGSVILGTQPDSQPQPPQNLTVIDFLARKDLQLSFTKDTQYSLQFKNFPPAFCLSINSTQYPIQNDQLASLKFTQAGIYSLRVDFCDASAGTLGQVTVQ